MKNVQKFFQARPLMTQMTAISAEIVHMSVEAYKSMMLFFESPQQ